MFFVVVYLTLTDPLRIQPWSQNRRNQAKIKETRTGKVDKRNGHESSQQRTSSPGRDTEETKNKVKVWICASPEAQ